MSTHLDSMMFPLADALQTKLVLTQDGFEGEVKREIDLGSWRVTMGGPLRSLHYTSDAVSCVAKLRKSLYFFIVCDQAGHQVRGVLFDGAAMGIKDGKIPGSPKMAFDKIAKAAVKWMKFDKSSNKWKTINAFNLD